MSANAEASSRFWDIARFLAEPCILVDLRGTVVQASADVKRLAPVEIGEDLFRWVETPRDAVLGFLRNAARARDPIPGTIEFAGCERSEHVRACRFGDHFGEALVFLHFSARMSLAQRFLALDEEMRTREIETQRRRQVEQERWDLQQELARSEKLQSLGLMAGGVAHDFNNLLMSVLANADLCLEEVKGSCVESSLRDIRAAALQARALCGELLAYAGKGQFVLETVDLRSLVREVVSVLKVTTPAECVLRCENRTEVALPVRVDAAQVRQVVMNLVTNAVEALRGEAGSVSVDQKIVECDEVALAELSSSAPNMRPGSYAAVDVIDTGCGMDKATASRIFDPFFSTKLSGRGLGLAATAGIASSHGGGIVVWSEPGRGTHFRMLLPLSSESVAAPADTPSPGADSGPVATVPVLLVDDDEMVRRAAVRILERGGFGVVTASNGDEALAIFGSQPDRFGIAILDLTMPGKSGVQVFRGLRAIRPELPVLLSSGYTETELAASDLDIRTDFLQKPYRPHALLSRIHQMLARRG
jgi:two-component system, cell cycle sensor histidine kinase and response regulator CckA